MPENEGKSRHLVLLEMLSDQALVYQVAVDLCRARESCDKIVELLQKRAVYTAAAAGNEASPSPKNPVAERALLMANAFAEAERLGLLSDADLIKEYRGACSARHIHPGGLIIPFRSRSTDSFDTIDIERMPIFWRCVQHLIEKFTEDLSEDDVVAVSVRTGEKMIFQRL